MDCKENCLHCAEKCNTKSNTNQHGNCELKSELKDEELIKDLKTFISLSKHITEPPYVQHIFLQQILDLINRQKAEIISRTEEYNDMLEQRNKVEEALELKIMDVNSLTSERDVLEETVAEQKAEVERLQCEVKNCRDVIKEQSEEWHKHYNDSVTYKTALDSVCKELRTAKSEAIKEFAEKVYRFLCNWRNWNKLKVSWLFNGECEWLKKSLDNLVKEMAESNELQQDF